MACSSSGTRPSSTEEEEDEEEVLLERDDEEVKKEAVLDDEVEEAIVGQLEVLVQDLYDPGTAIEKHERARRLREGEGRPVQEEIVLSGGSCLWQPL